jgi:hypothetical protein
MRKPILIFLVICLLLPGQAWANGMFFSAAQGASESPARRTEPAAANLSSLTTCAEEDNVNIPIFAPRARSFLLTATHPAYEIEEDNCGADWSGCEGELTPRAEVAEPGGDVCTKVWDDGSTVIEVCTMPDWWRPYTMEVVLGEQRFTCHYLRWSRKIEGAESWPQFAVLYQDGNLRLKPHPPTALPDVCFGSSVIIGPASPSARPYVDIAEVVLRPEQMALGIRYRDRGAAAVQFSVSRTQASAKVRVRYDTRLPIATFRSMWVEDGNCDVDSIQTDTADLPILGDWRRAAGTSWRFYRGTWSRHNTSAPDLQISVARPH